MTANIPEASSAGSKGLPSTIEKKNHFNRHIQAAFRALDKSHCLSSEVRKKLRRDLDILKQHPVEDLESVKKLYENSKKLRDKHTPWVDRLVLAISLRDQLHALTQPASKDVFEILLRIDDLLRESDFEKWEPVPCEKSLISQKVQIHNEHVDPRSDKAGKVVYETQVCKVQYNQEGILVFSEKSTTPGQITLSAAQIQTLTRMAKETMDLLSLNTMGQLLDFVSYVHQKQPLGWQEAMVQYPLNAARLLQQYRGGTPELVALALQEKLSSTGIPVNLVGVDRIGDLAFKFPVPSQRCSDDAVWKEAKDAFGGLTHYLCAIPYSEEGKEKVLEIKQYFSSAETIKTHSSAADYQADNPSAVTLATDQGKELSKNFLRTKFSYFIEHPHTKEICRLGLLSGTLSISPGKEFTAIPKNGAGEQIFCLSDLIAHPDEKINILVDNQLQIVKKREALKLYLNAIRVAFQLPQDFADNLIFLMQQRKNFISEVMVSPAKTLLEVWPLYMEVDTIKRKAVFIVARTAERFMAKIPPLQEPAEKAYDNALKAMYVGATEDARQNFLKAKEAYETLMNRCASFQNTPLEVILENYENTYGPI
ncbi:MAG: hypothetical protein LLG04_00115 [Parachlamydia sp.]|nr:hypothetical protein [Parachlamydia sp.]